MNTVQDLRSTLDQRARALHDDDVLVRATAVHGRVRAVRRRRAAAAVAAAAVAVAGVASTALVGGGTAPQPADRRLVGQVAPAEMTSLGWTYAFAEGHEGDRPGEVRIRLEADDQPRLVSWATASAAQDVVHRLSAYGPESSSAADFADFVWVPPGFDGTLTIEGEGELGAAVYELTDEAPEGYTRGGITFRQDVADRRLLGAVVADPGVAEVELEVRPALRGLSLATLCTGGARRAWTHLSINGEEVSWGPGCDDRRFDPGAGELETEVADDGVPATLRLWVTQGEKGPLVEDDDLVLGLGAYEIPSPSAQAARQRVDELVEHDGHLWRLVDTTTGEVGQRKLVVTAHPGPETLVRVYFTNQRGGIAYPVLDGRRTGGGFGGGTGSTFAGVLHGEGTGGVMITGDPGPRAQLGVARYERAD